jgi:hypothetical protein
MLLVMDNLLGRKAISIHKLGQIPEQFGKIRKDLIEKSGNG